MARLFLQMPAQQQIRRRILLTAMTLLGSSLGWAAPNNDTPPWYQVELFVFSQNQDNLMTESWDDQMQPQLSSKTISLYGERARKSGLVLLNSSSRALPIAKSLMTRRGYQPLFHQVWQQPLLPKRQALPIHIRGGEQLNDQTFELDGDITLDIARYLHLRTNLFYTLRKPTDWPTDTAATEDISTEANSDPEIVFQPLPTIEQSTEPADATETPVISKDPTLLTVQMKQGRRMRRDQLHYLDHPLFGLFIKMTRIKGPTALLAEPPHTLEQSVSIEVISPAETTPTKPLLATPVPVSSNPATISASRPQ